MATFKIWYPFGTGEAVEEGMWGSNKGAFAFVHGLTANLISS